MEVFMSNDFHVAKAKMIAFFVHLMDRLDGDARIQCGIDVDFAEEIVALSSVQNWQQWSSYMMDRLRSVIKENKDQYFPKPLSQAVNFIKENYAKPLQLSSVAEKCEISQGYLSRLFQEFLNTTFIDYLNTLRIGEAVKLLRNDRKSVKEVSYLVGYADPNYFSRIFRRYMNVSPSDLTKGGGNNEE
jgi:two-component system response regulator YesN